MARLIGLQILAGQAPGNLLCEFRLDAGGRAALVYETDTWMCDDLANNGVVTGGAATPFVPLLAAGYGLQVELHRRYFPSDGEPFLIAAMAELYTGYRYWFRAVIVDEAGVEFIEEQ